jgi:hypothetical protein
MATDPGSVRLKSLKAVSPIEVLVTHSTVPASQADTVNFTHGAQMVMISMRFSRPVKSWGVRV